MLRNRDAVIRDEVTTAPPTGVAIIKLSSELVFRKLAVVCDPPPTKIGEVLIVDQNILALSIALSRLSRSAAPGSHIGDQRRFDVVHGFAIRGMLTIGAKNSDYDRLDSQFSAIPQAIFAPHFLSFEHLNFAL